MYTKETAVLVLDHQEMLISNYVSGRDAYLARVSTFLQSVRSNNIPVIFVTVGFRPDFPEVSDRNKIFSFVRDGGRLVNGAAGTQIPAGLYLENSDLIVNKHRVSAFEGTELQVLLRSQGVTRLVLFGVTTSGVVLSTVRQGADLDYEISVLEDFCHDPNPDVQEVLLCKVIPMQATVTTSQHFLDALNS